MSDIGITSTRALLKSLISNITLHIGMPTIVNHSINWSKLPYEIMSTAANITIREVTKKANLHADVISIILGFTRNLGKANFNVNGGEKDWFYPLTGIILPLNTFFNNPIHPLIMYTGIETFNNAVKAYKEEPYDLNNIKYEIIKGIIKGAAQSYLISSAIELFYPKVILEGVNYILPAIIEKLAVEVGASTLGSVIIPGSIIAGIIYVSYLNYLNFPNLIKEFNTPYSNKTYQVAELNYLIINHKLDKLNENYHILLESNDTDGKDFHIIVFDELSFETKQLNITIALEANENEKNWDHYLSAMKFINESLNEIRIKYQNIKSKDIHFTVTGYKDGAVIADIVTYQLKNQGINHIKTFNFDHPGGSKYIIEQLMGIKPIDEKNNTIKIFTNLKKDIPQNIMHQYQSDLKISYIDLAMKDLNLKEEELIGKVHGLGLNDILNSCKFSEENKIEKVNLENAEDILTHMSTQDFIFQYLY